MRFLTKGPSQTIKIGRVLAGEVKKSVLKNKAFVLALKGDLGGGKTTFLKGFAQGLGIKQRITSPTFVIIKRFQLNNLTIKQFNNFYHIDCYRVQKPKEILNLGFREIIANSRNIVAIEWADRIKKILPKNSVLIEFRFLGKNTRMITFKFKR